MAEAEIKFHSELDALIGLSTEMYRIAKQANGAVKQLASAPGGPGFGLAVDSDTSAISKALRYQQPEKPAQFVYFGVVDVKGAVDEILRSFKPIVSFELFELGNNRNMAAALASMTVDAISKGDTGKFETLADSCRRQLTRIIVRASLLALTIQHLTRSYALDLLTKLMKGETAEYLAWRTDFETKHTKLRTALESAYPDSTTGALGVPAGFLVATSFNLSPNQQAINGVYFPPEHEAFVIKRLSAMQAEALSQQR